MSTDELSLNGFIDIVQAHAAYCHYRWEDGEDGVRIWKEGRCAQRASEALYFICMMTVGDRGEQTYSHARKHIQTYTHTRTERELDSPTNVTQKVEGIRASSFVHVCIRVCVNTYE